MTLKFVSYEYEGALCDGILIMELNEEQIIFPEGCLETGGSITFDGDPDGDDFEVFFNKGKWTIGEYPGKFPDNLKQLAIELVNKNVEHGCCGYCW